MQEPKQDDDASLGANEDFSEAKIRYRQREASWQCCLTLKCRRVTENKSDSAASQSPDTSDRAPCF
jgi:hypothetical protein